MLVPKYSSLEDFMIHRTVLAFAILILAPTLGAAVETPEERQACANDANLLCPDEIPDRERVYACLTKKIRQLSPPCKKIISESIAPPQRRR
jgi:hypothetical protein